MNDSIRNPGSCWGSPEGSRHVEKGEGQWSEEAVTVTWVHKGTKHKQALPFLATSTPLRIPSPLPNHPSVPPDIPKLKINVTPSEATVKEGESVTMTCQVISSNPEHGTVSWLKDGTALGEKRLSLTLSSVTKDSSGKYHCQASNDRGVGMSEEVALDVLCEPPRS